MNQALPETRLTRQFVLLVLLLLVACFAIWTAMGQSSAMPAVGFANKLLQAWMPELVHSLYITEDSAVLVAAFGEHQGEVLPANRAGNNLAFTINTMALSYSLPFYTALFFATSREEYIGDYFKGCLILYLFIFLGLVSGVLKELMLNLGSEFRQQGVPLLPPNGIIAIIYQLNSILLPTLAPALIWIWQSRHTPLLRGLFPEDQNHKDLSDP